MDTKNKPSVIRMIQSDYMVLLGVLLPVVSLVLYVSVAYFGFFPGFRGHDPIQGTDGAPLFFYLFLAGLVIGLPLAYWRIRSVQGLFSRSVEVSGQITNVSFFRDRGRIDYEYVYQGQKCSGGTAVMKNGQTQSMRPGIAIVLLVDPDQPKRALIRDLYV
jgi:hypothetical protein